MILARSPRSPRSVVPLEEEDGLTALTENCSSAGCHQRTIPSLKLNRKRVTFHTSVSASNSGDGEADTPNEEVSHDDDRQVRCHFGPVRPALSKEETRIMCWTRHDFRQFKREAKELAQFTDEAGWSDYIRIFRKVYSKQPKDEKHVGFVNIKDFSAVPLAIAPTRGLERFVFPGLTNDQNRVKMSVLKAQASLPKDMDQSTRERIISSTSEKLSRQARHVARVLGHGDSIIALNIYKKTFGVGS